MLEERRLETADAASSLPAPNEFYLLKVDDTRQAHFKALGEVREQIEKNLLLDERTRLEKAWIERLKKKTFVRYF
jgi:hypothetical protein